MAILAGDQSDTHFSKLISETPKKKKKKKTKLYDI
jgi:hypothetical protein